MRNAECGIQKFIPHFKGFAGGLWATHAMKNGRSNFSENFWHFVERIYGREAY